MERSWESPGVRHFKADADSLITQPLALTLGSCALIVTLSLDNQAVLAHAARMLFLRWTVLEQR